MTLLNPVRTLLGCWLWLRAFVTGPPAAPVPKVCPYCDGLGRRDGCPSCQKLSDDWMDDFADTVKAADARARAAVDAECARLETARQDERVRRLIVDAAVEAATRGPFYVSSSGPRRMATSGLGWEGGHGHVTPRPDGLLAGCGGPGVCRQCAVEQADRDRCRLFEPKPAKDARGA